MPTLTRSGITPPAGVLYPVQSTPAGTLKGKRLYNAMGTYSNLGLNHRMYMLGHFTEDAARLLYLEILL